MRHCLSGKQIRYHSHLRRSTFLALWPVASPRWRRGPSNSGTPLVCDQEVRPQAAGTLFHLYPPDYRAVLVTTRVNPSRVAASARVLLGRSRRNGGPSACGADCAGELVDVVGAVVTAAVDEERWRAGDPAEICAVDVLRDASCADVMLEIIAEPFDVEPEPLGTRDQIRLLERGLFGEQQVVHLPEGALLCGGLGGFGGHLCVGMDVVQWEVAPDVAEVAEVLHELADDGLGATAVQTLEVAVLDERDRRIRRAPDVVALGIDEH